MQSSVAFPAIFEFGQMLRRRVWQPLHRMLEIFHVVPLTGAIVVFLLLTMVGQLREIYVSSLEELGVTAIVAAALGFALLSAAFVESHYWLSTMRMNVVFSSVSNPSAGSLLRGLQRIAAFVLALVPWLGLAVGMLLTKSFLVDRYAQLVTAKVGTAELDAMHHLLRASSEAIVVSVVVLGLALAAFLDRYRRHTIIQHVTIIVIPLIAALFVVLVTDLQLGLLWGFGVGLASAMIIVAYWLVYYRLSEFRTLVVYTHRWRRDTGINWRRRRRVALFIWAFLPSAAIALYFADVFALPASLVAPSSRWAMLPVAMAWVMAAGLLVAMLLDNFRESVWLQRIIVTAIAVLMLSSVVVSFFDVDSMVRLYRWLGPLGTLALELTFVFATFTLLSVLSQKSGFPALSLVILAIVVSAVFPVPPWWTATGLAVVCGIVAVMALVSRKWSVAGVAAVLMLPGVIAWTQDSRAVDVTLKDAPAASATPDPNREPALKQPFAQWLAPRLAGAGAAASPGSKYPVFIIAVEGGGIYAAAAASLLLAKLEDAIPGFSQHVFAISGVSGGAIGATVFQSLARAVQSSAGGQAHTVNAGDGPASATTPSPPKGCPQDPDTARQRDPTQPLTARVAKVIQDDHFSPAVGAIFSEVLGAPKGRPEVLAASFTNSVCSQDDVAGAALNRRYRDHWFTTALAPALVLNSTWVETGFRVAFAPFALHESDDSLYSFAHEAMPGDEATSLIQAAVVSARFPGMLPAYSMVMKANGRPLRWNFVDGGYADNSGASTALALHRALEKVAGDRAEVRVILLTGSNPEPDLSPNSVNITGTTFRDTLAPIAAVMKVRAGLGNQAVARACDAFYPGMDCKKEASERNARLKIVEIEEETYGLPLGWKLSRSTFEIVKWMLGRPELCGDGKPPTAATTEQWSLSAQDGPQLDEKTVRSNSCVLKSIESLLTERQSGQR
jgi:hypothetical protein